MRKAGRKSLIVGILALALVFAGTGYAYWTDTLNVTTRATTGDFGVQFVDLGLYAQYPNETVDTQHGWWCWGWTEDGWSIVDGIGRDHYVNDEFFMRGDSDYNAIAKPGSIAAYGERAKGWNSIEFKAELVDADWITTAVGPYNSANAKGSDQIYLEINKMYPGYAQAFRSDIINVGDIAAKLSAMDFAVEADDDPGYVKEMLGIAVYMQREQYEGGTVEDDTFKLCDALEGVGPENFFKVGGVDFIRLSALDNAAIRCALENNMLLCNPSDNRMDIFIGVAMDPDAAGKYTTGSTCLMADNDDALSQNKGVTITIDLLWDQFNVGKDTDNANILKLQNR